MPIKREAKRIKWGNMLSDAENQISNAFTMLDTVKNQLVTGRNRMESDPAFTPADLAEVDETIALIDAKYTP